ncbi:MAG: transcriptional repressor LexA [Candidatus Paceibacterota bacterium]|jgi:repressor LexA
MNKNTRDKDISVLKFIRNTFINSGTGPSLREINEVTGGKSPRSASIILDRLEKDGFIKRQNGKIISIAFEKPNSVSTINIPLVGAVPCGAPMLAEQNIETYIPVSTALAKKGSNYFLLRATGDSMNLAGINDKDILLVRQQETADNGEKVVALIDEEATVKILDKKDDVVILRPKSSNSSHKPIILSNNCQIQGVVVAVLPSDLY